MNPTRILLVDDDHELVRSLRASLIQEGYEIITAPNGLEGLQTAHHTQPDLIVLDVNMPWMDGLELCRRLRLDADAHLRQIPIIFLTARDSLDERVAGLDEGADDYLTKPFQAKELKARIRAILRRRDHPVEEPHTQLAVGPFTLHLQACWVRYQDGPPTQLTPAEFDLLYYLMSHPNRPFSSQELLEEVWSYAPGTADPSLTRWHIKNLRLKIEPDPQHPAFLRTVGRMGYMLADS